MVDCRNFGIQHVGRIADGSTYKLSQEVHNELHSVALCYKLLTHVPTIFTRGYIHVSAG